MSRHVDRPLTVLADADVGYAVSAAAFGAFLHQGQICMSARRVIVDRAVADEFTGRLAEGIVHVNDQPVHDEPQMPFGGVKDSGWGRFGGAAATEECTELKWVTVFRAAPARSRSREPVMSSALHAAPSHPCSLGPCRSPPGGQANPPDRGT